MDEFKITKHEVDVRSRLLRHFEACDKERRCVIHASEFERSLDSEGLSFGNEVVDRVMLLCKIDDRGMVDFSQFAEDVARRRSSTTGPKPTYLDRGPTAATGAGIEFHEALESSVGARMGRTLAPELAELSQADRVRKLTPELKQLFKEFDNGRIPLSVFREELRDLGIVETPELKRLLRQTPVRFSELIKTLTLESVVSKPRAVAAGSKTMTGVACGIFTDDNVPMKGRKPATATTERSADVIAWTTPSRPTEERSLTGDSGKGRCMGDLMTKDTGAAEALWGGDAGGAPRFETVSQHSARSGLHGKKAGSVAVTSDKGIVREQIYGSVRQLDAGAISVGQFRAQLRSLGVEAPPIIDKLLNDYRATGRADFSKFVRAFEEYFASRSRARGAVAEEVPATPARSVAPPTPPSRRMRGAPPVVPTAMRAHGDIVTWHGAGTITEDEDRQMRRRGMTPGKITRTARDSQRDLLQWSGRDAGSTGPAPDLVGFRGVHRVSRRAPVEGHEPKRTGGLISWDESGRRIDTSEESRITHDGRVVNRGKARPATAITALEASRVCPYGTEADMKSEVKDYVASGTKARAYYNTPTTKTGEWLKHTAPVRFEDYRMR